MIQQAAEAAQVQSIQVQPTHAQFIQTEPIQTKQPVVKIGLVHPIELTDVSLSKWRQQLEDYEIIQPITQLYRPVYRLTDAEKEMPTLERFGGLKINDLSLMSRLTGAGWYRGSVQDAGGFYTFYREDIEMGLGVELHFSGSFVDSGYGGGEEITVYDARFYKIGTIARQLANATAASESKDEGWRKNSYMEKGK